MADRGLAGWGAVRRAAAALAAAALAGGAFMAGAAQAQSFARAAVWNGRGGDLVSEQVTQGRAAAEDSRGASNGSTTRWDYVAAASASLNTGALRSGLIVVSSGPSSHWGVTVNTLATVFEQLTFHGPRPAEVAFTLAVTGSFASFAQADFLADAALYFGNERASVLFGYLGRPLDADPRASAAIGGEGVVLNDQPDRLSAVLRVRRLVQPNETLPIQAELALRLRSDNNDHAVANFGRTAQLGFVLPEGFSFTSSSGTFMTETTSPVPEPQTGLLWAAGLVLCGLRLRRGRRPPVRPLRPPAAAPA